jgi:glutamate racemase
MPYGNRSLEIVRNRVQRLIAFLRTKGAKLIVIACNTATVAGIDAYRRRFADVPIIGVVPVIKTAVSLTRTNHIAVLSTPNTAEGAYQKRLIDIYAKGRVVKNIGMPDLAQRIEEGAEDVVIDQTVARYLTPGKLRSVDTIALGCTHYPFVADSIARVAGNHVRIIDSGAAVARHVAAVLGKEALRSESKTAYTQWYTTGNARVVSRAAKRLMGTSLSFAYVRL